MEGENAPLYCICRKPDINCFMIVFVVLHLSPLPRTALYRGGVMTAPAPGSDTCKQSSHPLLKAAAESASSLDYCVTLISRQPEDRRLALP
ncbi:CXXC-type zinc finger protein 1b [Simochromis diagramma]|uniref:CXXC-type zinc finger protein 1b n=1 Tax=Simochromis diagramma TaxID=43689 RepID=UPI001A7E37BF|nr:CXXC-type zinc finger protein 1b [Simochromis diagramma]